MANTNGDAGKQFAEAMRETDDYYRARGVFQDRVGFGLKPAVVVVDFAYGWTDDAYPGGSKRLDGPVACTRRLLDAARPKNIPVIFTTSPWRADCPDKPFKSSPPFREWDERACEIDERVAPQPGELLIEKESASAFFATHLAPYLIQHAVDTVLITGCSTSACIRATATDAKSYRFRPVIIEDCVGDRAAAAHVFTLFDIQARFADVVPLGRALEYIESL